MNKIYKVIWSKARHQYVVASELAKSVTKGAGSRIGRTAAAVLAAIVLTAGAGLPAQAADLTSTSTTYTLDLGVLGSYEINTPITVTTSGENVAASLEGQSLNLGGLTVSGTNVLTEAAMDGVVKWDDETDNSIHGVRFDGNGALSADSLSVAEDRFSVDKYGNIAAQTYGGEGDDTHYYFDMSHADGIQMGYSNGSSMNIDPFGVHFKVGEQETTINGNTIVTGRVNADTVQADNMYVGTQTPGHAVVTQDQLTDGIDTATEGVVKWDEDGNGGYKEGYLTAEHQLSAGNGNLLVDEEGVHLKTPGEILGDAKDETNYYLDMTNEHGIQMGYTGSTSMTITNQGVTFADASGNSTVINGNSIDSGANGSLHTGTVYANNGMYIGDASNPDNAVATKGDLSDAVSTATDGMVKWDQDETTGEYTNSINGVGLEDGKITAENGGNIGGVEFGGNGTINAADGNFTVDENGNTGIGGNLDVAGDLTIKDGQGGYINVGDSLTSIKDSIADVNSDISGVKFGVAQNTADISGIKGQIGAVGEDGSLGLTNGADTLVGGINQNASAIQANKDAIGDVSSLKGTDASGNKYTNLTDAVNGNYDAIQVTQTAVQQQGQAINALGGRVHELGEEIDSVGAISSALAGLHPLDYDGTGSKFQLSAAMGTYDGTQAAAIGGFYHFNEDVMLSLGGATAFNGEHKTAANIGVTFRVGPGGSEKKPATPDEVMATLDAMNRKIQEMDAKIAALEQDKKDLTEENQQLKAEAAEAVTAEAPAAEEQA